MSKKKKEEERTSRPRARFMDLVAFLALAASAILLLLGPILRKFIHTAGIDVTVQALSMVAQYCLLAAIAIPAWYFVRRKGIGWKVFYLICLVVYIVGAILGVALGI